MNILTHEYPAVFWWDAACTSNPISMFRVNLMSSSSWLDMPCKNSKMALLCLKTSASDYTMTQRRVPEEQNTHLHLCENFTTRTITYIYTCACVELKCWLVRQYYEMDDRRILVRGEGFFSSSPLKDPLHISGPFHGVTLTTHLYLVPRVKKGRSFHLHLAHIITTRVHNSKQHLPVMNSTQHNGQLPRIRQPIPHITWS